MMVLLTLQAQEEWEVRHGGLMGLKYLMAVRQVKTTVCWADICQGQWLSPLSVSWIWIKITQKFHVVFVQKSVSLLCVSVARFIQSFSVTCGHILKDFFLLLQLIIRSSVVKRSDATNGPGALSAPNHWFSYWSMHRFFNQFFFSILTFSLIHRIWPENCYLWCWTL